MLPKQRGLRREANVSGRLTTTYGTLLTASATIHTLGTKVELFASTSFDTYWVDIYVHDSAVTNGATDQLMNVYVGADTQEQLLIPNLQTGWARQIGGGISYGRTYSFPLRIPAGSRITADLQALVASDIVRVLMVLFGGDPILHWTGTKVETIGMVTSVSRGTLVTVGTTAEGALTRLGASDGAATLAHDWGFVLAETGSTDSSQPATQDHLDLGTSVAVISGLEDFRSTWPATEDMTSSEGGRFCYVPAGTVLHARIQALDNGNTQRTVMAHGVY
jgi:hypothetical protein